MKNSKKLLALFLATQISLLAGCGNKPAETKSMDISTPVTASSDTDSSSESTSLEDSINSYFKEMPKHIYKIGQADFVNLVKDGGEFTVIDIRSAKDYAKGHIKGAVNIPWGSDIGENIDRIPSDKEAYVYCYSGQTAGQAVMTLNLAGIPTRSVNLGWNFGISKVEGVESITETTDNTLPDKKNEINPDIVEAIKDYYNGLNDVSGSKYKNYKVSEKDLSSMLENDEDFYLLSIRSAKDYAAEHISNSNNIPWGNEMYEAFSSLPKDKKIVVYCYSGQTAGQTTAALRLLGYDAVSLNGGMGVGSNAPLGWKNKGYETTNDSNISSKINDYFANMPKHIYKIGQADFVDLVKEGGDFTIIDIRSATDYSKGHIKGAINLPWGSAISDNIKKIPSNKEAYVYCYSGQTAGQAVMTLNLAGIPTRSVNLGWNFGISKVEDVEAVTETTENTLPEKQYPVDENIVSALSAYYNGLADAKETIYKNYKISEDNLSSLINEKKDFYLLSIRSEKDYTAEHISDAKNIPWGNEMYDAFSSLPKDKKIVVYCYSGQTAGQTTAALRLLGYDAVSLNGGLGVKSNAPLGWKNKGFDTTK